MLYVCQQVQNKLCHSVRATVTRLLSAGGSDLKTLFVHLQKTGCSPEREETVSAFTSHTLNYTTFVCFVTNKTKTEMEANLKRPCYIQSLNV